MLYAQTELRMQSYDAMNIAKILGFRAKSQPDADLDLEGTVAVARIPRLAGEADAGVTSGCVPARNPRSAGGDFLLSPQILRSIYPCSSCYNFAYVAPFWAYSISKCSPQRVHHFISLHHFHSSSS